MTLAAARGIGAERTGRSWTCGRPGHVCRVWMPLRVEAARRLLETASLSVAEVAAACGFGRVETMHRAFRRGVRVSPGQYRRHFRAAS